jgi:putative DNA primase/helicase
MINSAYSNPQPTDLAPALPPIPPATHESALEPANDGSVITGAKPELPPEVESYLATSQFHHLRYRGDGFEEYVAGYWRPVHSMALEQDVAYFYRTEATRAKVSGLTALLELFKFTPESDVIQSPNHICMDNGTYNTVTGILEAHNPDHHLSSKLAFRYLPEAICPTWIASLGQMFEGETGGAMIGLLQEMFGYCLVQQNHLDKCFIFLGNGGNGKSVVLHILEQLLGPDNVLHAMIDQLKLSYVRAELEGKLANITHEMSPKSGQFDSNFKAIVSGEPFQADRKFKDSRTIHSHAKLVMATNNLPALKDFTNGIRRRVVIIPFERTFTLAEQHPQLKEALGAEIEGIFVWALAGLARLRERGKFDLPAASEAVLAAYMEESDPVGLFVTQALEADPMERMKPTLIHEYYSAWCSAFGFKVENSIVVGKRLEKAGYLSMHSSGCKFWRVQPKAHNGFVWPAQ